MSNISLVEATLPPGFRFHPRDEELICDYLLNKFSLSGSPLLVEIDLNKCEPWDLPETARVGGKEWSFYSHRDRKYATGLRTNRATLSGYWKATGKDRSIFRNRTLVGMRKTLVFYLGRAPKGKKSNWVMHEFRSQGPQTPPVDSSLKDDLVLCRVFCKKTETNDGKQNNNMGSINKNVRHEDKVRCSSSLPPLMEPHPLSLNQNQHTNNYIKSSMFNQQVPCFSTIFNQYNPQFDLINNDHQVFSTIVPPQPSGLTITSTESSSSSHCGDKKDVIKDILYRFNNMDELNNSSDAMFSFDEGNVDQNFLSDVNLPVTMWYP